MPEALTESEKAQLEQTIEMFEVITQSVPNDYQSLEILKEAYFKLGREKDVNNTAKRIAQAYVGLGQLSSAILEYESILQRNPDDPDVLKALADIENRATSFSAPVETVEPAPAAKPAAADAKGKPGQKAATVGDDGRQMMERILVDGKFISGGDFSLYWSTPDPSPGQVVEPFLQILADKGLMPLDQSVKLVCEKSRLAFLPMEKYDIDIEVARSAPRDVCQRWCVLPFDRMSKSVFVATTNPFNKQAAADLESSLKGRIIWYIASPPELVKVVKKVFR